MLDLWVKLHVKKMLFLLRKNLENRFIYMMHNDELEKIKNFYT